MTYHVELTESAKKELKKLDKYTQKIILLWLNKNLEGCKDPRVHGKPLTADRVGQWRYRIGDYRVIVVFRFVFRLSHSQRFRLQIQW